MMALSDSSAVIPGMIGDIRYVTLIINRVLLL